jgi:hypothetical protein
VHILAYLFAAACFAVMVAAAFADRRDIPPPDE